ncbi:hypothetical protein MTR_5g035460 [Medicago truncatula]|uniref:Transmembrane protein n=1 Tax=Medicago truncatula TaxID=3880 RepID=G7K453_MEDTR|nr:hypothetical protein MTR_5g035460 [Medicago truncatula]
MALAALAILGQISCFGSSISIIDRLSEVINAVDPMDFTNFDRSYSVVNEKLKLNCETETTETEVLAHGFY